MSGTVPRDPYDVLGIRRNPDETTIKKAFRKLARELHPNVNAHDPDAEEKFKEAAEAYEILNDPERRATYDRYGHEGLRSGGMGPNFEGFGSISDLFDAFFGGAFSGAFGGRPGGPVQGDDIAVSAEVTLEQAAAGASLQLSFEAIDACERCHGNGAEPGTPITTCERCGGAGILQAVSRSAFGQVVRQVPCDVCGGDGKVPESPCERCEGRGREVRRRTLSVDVPPGISDGQRIRLSGRGHAGERGGPPGDLYVLVHVEPDERFVSGARTRRSPGPSCSSSRPRASRSATSATSSSMRSTGRPGSCPRCPTCGRGRAGRSSRSRPRSSRTAGTSAGRPFTARWRCTPAGARCAYGRRGSRRFARALSRSW